MNKELDELLRKELGDHAVDQLKEFANTLEGKTPDEMAESLKKKLQIPGTTREPTVGTIVVTAIVVR